MSFGGFHAGLGLRYRAFLGDEPRFREDKVVSGIPNLIEGDDSRYDYR